MLSLTNNIVLEFPQLIAAEDDILASFLFKSFNNFHICFPHHMHVACSTSIYDGLLAEIVKAPEDSPFLVKMFDFVNFQLSRQPEKRLLLLH